MSDDSEECKRPQFGSRFLKDEESVLKHNCWDNVQWDPELLEAAQQKIQQQAEKKIPEDAKEQLQKETGHRWDKFYDCHQNRFFKDRHWLFTEFPELAMFKKPETPVRVFPGAGGSELSVANKENKRDLQSEEAHGESKKLDDSLSKVVLKDYIRSESVVDNNKSESTSELATNHEKQNADYIYKSDISNDLATNHDVGQNQLTGKDDESVERNSDESQSPQKLILEIGCGVGNTIFPILEYNIDPQIFVYGCDFSENAIEILKSNPEYNPKRCHAFGCDVTDDDWKAPFPKNSLDISTLIFVLSAIHPQKMQHVVQQLYDHLKPGGQVLFRDYGRYDMAQLRFKSGQMMEDNFYVRSDGTFVYFFTQEEVTELFTKVGFQEEMIYTDRRLQVNRLRQLKMYRVWVQAKYRKPLSS